MFTTHTPVPAGNEVFDAELVERNVEQLVDALRLHVGRVRRARRESSPTTRGFGLTPFALRTSTYANGVSALHGEVSREMWHGLWPERPADEVPIGSVTNGVHARTWIDDDARCAPRRRGGHGHARLRAARYELDDEELWRASSAAKRELLARHALARMPARRSTRTR